MASKREISCAEIINDAHWTEREVDETAFKDQRFGRRFGELIRQIGDGMGESIPYACQDWASTKAAYRFFANDRVEEAECQRSPGIEPKVSIRN